MKKLNRRAFWIFCLLGLFTLTIYLGVPNRSGKTQESLESVESPGAVFTVTTNADSGAGSFRQAILDANANSGTDTIQFQIGTGPVDIFQNAILPDITQPVIIDGTTQPGFSGTPLIRISGSGLNPVFKITGGGSTVKALAVSGFRDGGIILENGGGNIVTGCFIGICPQDPTANCGNPVNGIQIINSPNNTIGGSTAAERNIIGGNGTNGIEITGNASSGNIVTGNYIGILPDNTIKKNQSSGVVINSAPNNRIGGTTVGERNVISGNGSGTDIPANQSKSAVLISGAGATGNVVEGNYIGTTIDGTARAGGVNDNRLNGVRIEGAANNRIGGSVGTTPGGACTGACNVISGFMFRGGVYITGGGATGNSVLGNFIGTNAAGTTNLANSVGVTITTAASNNTVGGTTATGRNLINNGLILSAGAATNIVQGNYIGTDTTGNTGIGFLSGGSIIAALTIDGAPNNTIGTVTGTTFGGACTGGCNLISGNNLLGVRITGSASTGNRVDYNYIGLNAAGTAALRNNGDAITLVNGANNNIIGRPLTTTPFQEIKPVENVELTNNICVQDDKTGDYITFKVNNDLRTATYTAIHAKSGESTSGTVDVGLFQSAIVLGGNGVNVSAELTTGKASATVRFPTPSNLVLIIRDKNVGNSTCIRPTDGVQTVVGQITNGATPSDTTNNNVFNGFTQGYSANERVRFNLQSENILNLSGNFCTYRNISSAVSDQTAALALRSGTDISFLWGSLFYSQNAPNLYSNLRFDNHDDGMVNPPVTNPGPGANRSQNSLQNVKIRLVNDDDGERVRFSGTLTSAPNMRYQVRVYVTYIEDLNFFELKRTIEINEEPIEVMTDGNGNAQVNHPFFENASVALLMESEQITTTVTKINQLPITSETGATIIVDVPGDTSEMSLPAVVPKPQFDFDEDGKTDIAVYRPGATPSAESFWYILNSGDFTFRIVQFGIGEDKIVAGDYQGDRVTDFAVFRPSNGTWYHSRLTGNPATNFVGIQWGLPTDIPVPGDYDDDGSNDAAIFRPSEGVWYIRRSIDGSLLANQFGNSTDKPVPADYDGDGQTDFAIYRNGQWWISPCAGCPARVITFGLATDNPVPGVDFNGDGADDIAVTRNDGGSKIWHWLESGSGSYRVAQFGLSADKVLAGDFDADGKSDLAVFRPSEGNWYVLRSEQGFFAINWGLSNDVPVPSAHLP